MLRGGTATHNCYVLEMTPRDKCVGLRVWCSGNTTAFQAVIRGSIPLTRSKMEFLTKMVLGALVRKAILRLNHGGRKSYRWITHIF